MRSTQLHSNFDNNHHPNLILGNTGAIDKVVEYDQSVLKHNSGRCHFLKTWLSTPDAFVVVYQDGQKVEGYGVLTVTEVLSNQKSYRLAPLLADTINIAVALLFSLISSIQNNMWSVIELNVMF